MIRMATGIRVILDNDLFTSLFKAIKVEVSLETKVEKNKQTIVSLMRMIPLMMVN